MNRKNSEIYWGFWKESFLEIPFGMMQSRDQIIQDFQQRLVLLFHASNCACSNAKPAQPCRSSPSCLDYTLLLKHCNQCDVADCIVPHCVSTRYLLTHSRDCDTDECFICKPLKLSIKRKQTSDSNIIRITSIRSQTDVETCSEESNPNIPRNLLYISSPKASAENLSQISYNSTNQQINPNNFDEGSKVVSGPSRVDNTNQSNPTMTSAYPAGLFKPPPINIHNSNSALLFNTKYSPRNVADAFTPRSTESSTKRKHYHACGDDRSSSLSSITCSTENEEEIGFETMLDFLATENYHIQDGMSGCYAMIATPSEQYHKSTPQVRPSPSLTSQFYCIKCSMQIAIGYRYSCAECQINVCTCCFHNVDSIPHSHPLRPHRISSYF